MGLLNISCSILYFGVISHPPAGFNKGLFGNHSRRCISDPSPPPSPQHVADVSRSLPVVPSRFTYPETNQSPQYPECLSDAAPSGSLHSFSLRMLAPSFTSPSHCKATLIFFWQCLCICLLCFDSSTYHSLSITGAIVIGCYLVFGRKPCSTPHLLYIVV